MKQPSGTYSNLFDDDDFLTEEDGDMDSELQVLVLSIRNCYFRFRAFGAYAQAFLYAHHTSETAALANEAILVDF